MAKASTPLWEVIGRGNANTVYRHRDRPGIGYRAAQNEQARATHSEYHSCVLPLLLPSTLICPMSIKQLPSEALDELRSLHGYVPSQVEAVPDLTAPATSWPEYLRPDRHICALPMSTRVVQSCRMTIEIKPKSGLYLSDENGRAHSRQCRFCLNQTIKARKGKTSSYSNYCPQQLFSKKSQACEQAILALFATPQNNLRLWINGAMMDLDAHGCGSLIEPYLDAPDVELAFAQLLATMLASTAVLDRLQALQDLSRVSPLQAHELRLASGLKTEADIPLQAWLDATHADQQDLSLKAQLAQYLLTATFRDCSIMVQMELEAEASSVKYSLVVVDVEPKALSKVAHHVERDAQLLALETPSHVSYCSRDAC
eukprot:TRINITY_DN6081_c0_g1_i1.p1 TRINITY_DN6081_c0_g1~~TRINITY_DN6081_c0_g1_i1.p1  ORF type:complete len:371 (+),score=46.40 TRINITY_DN6081_c0_g1_i1:44-1156(+)